MEGKAVTLDIRPLSIEQFASGEWIVEPMTAFKDQP